MDLNFLETQYERMRKIGAYAVLFRNSINKGTWKNYNFVEGYEQDNVIFSVLLYIMEQSSKEDICTIDDIADFLGTLDEVYLEKNLAYEQTKELADFIIDNILYDQGKAMYFKAYDFKEGEYKDINIAFVKSRMEEVDGIRRVSYHLTEQGYDLLLSTLEIEENLKITIQEIIFKEHLKKASYDKAIGDIKNIFDMYRRKILNMEDAVLRIKENPLSYSTEEYRKMMEGNFDFLEETKKKFSLHKERVEERINEFVEHDISLKELTQEEKESLTNLKIIKRYLNKVIDEDQKILIRHFNLKEAYSQELENIAKMSVIERFDFKKEVYDKVLGDINKLDNIDIFLRPLFNGKPNKIYNINKALEHQKIIKVKEVEEDVNLESDQAESLAEEEKRVKLKELEDYKKSIELILELTAKKDSITLFEINELIKENETVLNLLIPTIEIFREIIIEFLKVGIIDIKVVREESKASVDNGQIEFRLVQNILELLDENKGLEDIIYIEIEKIENSDDVILENVISNAGDYKKCICSNIIFKIKKGRNGKLWDIY